MKRVVIAVVVSVMFLTTAAAQNRPNTEQRQQPTVEQMAQNRTDRMAQMLSLDDKQKEQLYKLNLKTLKKQQGAREKASKLMEQAKDEAAQIRSEFDSSLKGILTAEQLQKYNERKMKPRNPRDGRLHKPMQDRPAAMCPAQCDCCKNESPCMKAARNACPDSGKGMHGGRYKRDTTRQTR